MQRVIIAARWPEMLIQNSRDFKLRQTIASNYPIIHVNNVKSSLIIVIRTRFILKWLHERNLKIRIHRKVWGPCDHNKTRMRSHREQIFNLYFFLFHWNVDRGLLPNQEPFDVSVDYANGSNLEDHTALF